MIRGKQLNELFNKMTPAQKNFCAMVIKENASKFYSAPGGLYKHQNWEGGYHDHVVETMAIATLLYQGLSQYRPLPFTLAESLYLIFIHDLEKMFILTISKNGKPIKIQTEIKGQSSFEKTMEMLDKYHLKLSKKHVNALKYCHGENEDYHPTKKIMNPLAAFIHCCDTISARIWYQYPKHKRS
ncbi:MAG: hypothetical protein V1860_01880 [bacterium]